jgi:hypothetical protein
MPFWALVVGVFLYRLSIQWAAGVPSGYDPGNWLYIGRATLGWGRDDLHLLYPPFVPVMAAAMWRVAGTHGLMLLGGVASVSPAVVGWFSWRRFRGGTHASALLAVFCPFGEAWAWGGWPTLLGIAWLIGAVGALDEWYRSASKISLGWYAAFSALLLATSHAVLLPYIVGVAVVTAVRVIEGGVRFRELVRVGAVSMVVGALFVPLYLRLLGQIYQSVERRQAVARPGALEMLTNQAALFDERTRMLWLGLFVLGVAVLAGRTVRYGALWCQALAFLGGVALLVITREDRFRFVIPVGLMLAVGVWVGSKNRAYTWRVTVCVLILLGAEMRAMAATTLSDTRFYRGINTEIIEGAEWMDQHLAADAVIATEADAQQSDGPWGWWVRGVSQRRTIVGIAPRWVNFDTEREDAFVANHIFSYPFGSDDQQRAAREAGVTHLVLTYRSEDFTSRVSESVEGGEVVFENGSMIVLKLGAA